MPIAFATLIKSMLKWRPRSGRSRRKTRRFEVIHDPSDLYEIWDNHLDLPVCGPGCQFSYGSWRQAARVACILNNAQDGAAPALIMSHPELRKHLRE